MMAPSAFLGQRGRRPKAFREDAMGTAARILHPSTLMRADGAPPMQTLNDLSRSLTLFEPDGTLIAVVEMSLMS